MLKEKVVALLKTLHQRPRSRLLPLSEFADAFISAVAFAHGSLVDVLLGAVRERTGLDVRRADFKQEQLPSHLLMNIRVIDENGRQLGVARNLAALKAELGGLARSAFQSLAALKLGDRAGAESPSAVATQRSSDRSNAGPKSTSEGRAASVSVDTGTTEPQRYTAWTFGELPELMEVRKSGQTLVGFPALIDRTTHVEVEVFDEPAVAAAKHRAGLRRLFALQIRDALRYLEKKPARRASARDCRTCRSARRLT
jgi:ATP-dependent helicase HrpA